MLYGWQDQQHVVKPDMHGNYAQKADGNPDKTENGFKVITTKMYVS